MLTIVESSSEVIDDFADTSELGVLVSGDIHDGDSGVAFYFARWFPERKSDIEILIVLLPEQASASQCSLGFRCSSAGQLTLVDAASLWIDWGPHAIPMTAGEAGTAYPQAYQRAHAIAQLLLCEDNSISDYLSI